MSGFANMREQFDTLKAENDPLKNQLDAANQEISRQKDWMEKAAMLWFDNTSKISELERQFNLKTLMLTIIFHMERCMLRIVLMNQRCHVKRTVLGIKDIIPI